MYILNAPRQDANTPVWLRPALIEPPGSCPAIADRFSWPVIGVLLPEEPLPVAVLASQQDDPMPYCVQFAGQGRYFYDRESAEAFAVALANATPDGRGALYAVAARHRETGEKLTLAHVAIFTDRGTPVWLRVADDGPGGPLAVSPSPRVR